MANNVWTTFIAHNGSNDILAASSADGVTWTPSVPINQTSPLTPSLALFEGVLYCAFITDDEDSATGVPSNRIFLCWTIDGVTWSNAIFFNQSSKCAPSLAVWNGKLHIAFVANNASNTLLVYLSPTPQDAQSWSATVATNQSSAKAPALASYQMVGGESQLYMAFVAGNGSEDIFVTSIAVGGQWSKATVTGQSSQFSPSLTVFGSALFLVFAAANGSKDLYQSGLEVNGTWSAAVLLNQSTAATPCAVGFGSDLAVAFLANNSSGEIVLASSSTPALPWPTTNVDVKQQSSAGPALAVAPFSCCYQLVPFSGIGGRTNYVFWAGLGPNNDPIPISGLVIEITIDEAIVVSPTSGITSTTPNALPIGFQINGLPPKADTQSGQTTTGWTPTPGDRALGWLQFGAKMWPKVPTLTAFAEYWPASVIGNPHVENTFNLSTPTPVTLPNDLTIPAGWTIRFTFTEDTDGTITGYGCTVKDQNGNLVDQPMGLNFLASTSQLAAGGQITTAVLSRMVAFQVVLVGFWSSAQAVLVSGGGTITVQAATPLTVRTNYPGDSNSEGTAEDTNSTYTLLPACSSKSFTQTFGVSKAS